MSFIPLNLFIFSNEVDFLSFYNIINKILLSTVQHFGLIILVVIYYYLFKNLFFFSVKYYLLTATLLADWTFNFVFLALFEHYQTIHISIILNLYFKRIKYKLSGINLLHNITNNMLIITLLVLALFSYVFVFNKFNSIETNYFVINFTADFYHGNFNVLKWISYLFDYIYIGFLIDNLSLLMIVIVLSISTLVHYYSIDYMASDPRLITFLKYLSGFTLAMLVLVTSNNYVLMFMGWEGVGIFSYLLIGFWYTRTLALKASLKAVIVNKVGDVALLIAIGLLLYYFGTTNFFELKSIITYIIDFKIDSFELKFYIPIKINLISLICFFLLVAAVGKSAQFGLHTWLPDAMEGPTPVSALIHAATMVTAGVYLIVRSSFLFECSEIMQNCVLIIGSFTALFGSAVACFQYDIKKIIAFSTCSQIGYMFLACGLSAYNVAMFHLFTHAFFKALLFLCAGSVIHAIADEQDIWKMGGLFYYLPITFSGIAIGLFSLMGLPFTSGFYSKDSIIEIAYSKNTFIGFYSFSCALLGAFLTAFYCYRFFFYVFFSKTKLSRIGVENIHESGSYLLSVIVILTFLTIFVGFIFKHPLSSPFSYIYFFSTITVTEKNFIFSQNEFFLYYFSYIKKIIFAIPMCGFFVSYLFFNNSKFNYFFNSIKDELLNFSQISNITFSRIVYLFWYCLQAKGLIDYVYNWLIVKPILNFSYSICYLELDWGWLEFFFVKTPTKILYFFAWFFSKNISTTIQMFLPAMIFLGSLWLVVVVIFLTK